jgi:hypothetical protein
MDSKTYVRQLLDEVSDIDRESKEFYVLSDLDRDELVETFVEIKPLNTDEFLKVKETLTRIGIANRTKKIIYQSCMVLQKRDKYYICHFKELFAMDGRHTEMYIDDYIRRAHIIRLLGEWNMIEVLNKDIMEVPTPENNINVYVLPYKEKFNWTLEAKYKIGTVPTTRRGQ